LISAGAPPQAPLGELTVLPQTSSWILGGLLLRERRGQKEERTGKGRKGEKGGKKGGQKGKGKRRG